MGTHHILDIQQEIFAQNLYITIYLI